jgi:mercuric ion transport protein
MSSDMPTSSATAGAGVLGVGVAACAACCAGPILGALGAIGIASAAGYLVAGSLAVAAGLLAVAVLVVRRRRRRVAGAAPGAAVAFVDAPVLRHERAEAGVARAP